MTPDLRQMRYVVEVAREGGFSRAAANLHVAQQAVSQQIKVVEAALGVKLFERTSRGVDLTAAGAAFVQEARRALNAADRVGQRAQAAARGEVGTLRLAYTLATVYETLPALIDALAAEHPGLTVRPREVFAEDIERLLGDERVDVALAPHVGHRSGLDQHTVRVEPFVAAVAENHPLAAEQHIPLAALADETIELWPQTMSPGYYDAAVAACRDAGFEPQLDEQAAGSTVWGNIARGRGVGLVVGSLRYQLPRGLVLMALAAPAPTGHRPRLAGRADDTRGATTHRGCRPASRGPRLGPSGGGAHSTGSLTDDCPAVTAWAPARPPARRHGWVGATTDWRAQRLVCRRLPRPARWSTGPCDSGGHC